MSWDTMTLQQRVQAANIDCMRHEEFCRLSGHICMGESKVVGPTDTVRIKGKDVDDPSKWVWVQVPVPTAMTDGIDKFYGAEFIAPMNRKKLRYVVLHENFHVAYRHCILYEDAMKINAAVANIAMDFVVNGTIEELDPDFKFVERPVEPMLVDKKYFGWSFPQVFNDLMHQVQQQQQSGKGKGKGSGQGQGVPGLGSTLDDHARGRFKGDHEGQQKAERQIEDANHQGEMVAKARKAGNEAGGRDILNKMQERTTDWKEPLREFICSICTGDDNSRFCPPNKRLLPLGVIMPSHFSESVGDLLLACDTSGSMHGYYPAVFGEIARIAQTAQPDSIRVLWWDNAVCGDQTFTKGDYDKLATLMKPAGGGGTTPNVVIDYMKEHDIKAKAIIWLTDGDLFCEDPIAPIPALWGVVNKPEFVPRQGKVIHIRV